MFKHQHPLCDVKWVSLPFVKARIHKQCKNGIYHKEWERRKRGQQEKMQPKGKNERIYVCAALIKDFRKKKEILEKSRQ